MIKVSAQHFVQLAENMTLLDLYDNLHTVLRFYQNNCTNRTTQE